MRSNRPFYDDLPPNAVSSLMMKRRKSAKKFPPVSKSDAASLPKNEAVLLRLTVQDKKTIVAAASKLHLTVTEFVTKASLIVAEKV